MRLEEFLVNELMALDAKEGIDAVTRLELEHILDSTTLRVLGALREFEATLPVYPTLTGEEEYHIMGIGCINVFGEVLLTGAGTTNAYSTPALSTEVRLQGALDIAQMRHSDNHWVVGIELLRIELGVRELNLSATLVAILLFHILQLVLHHLLTELWFIEYALQVSYEFFEVGILLTQFIDTQTSELTKTHINDSLRLQFVDSETLLQSTLGIAWSLRGTDNLYYLVNIIDSDNQALENVGTSLSLSLLKLGATNGDIMTVLNEVLDALLQ